MDIIEEVPGALRKAAASVGWNGLDPPADFSPVEREMWENMQCLVHANGDKSFVLASIIRGSFDGKWERCLRILEQMGERVSRAVKSFHKNYGLIETKKDNLRIEVYREHEGKVAVWSRHKRGWGISDGSREHIQRIMLFWKIFRQ